MSQKFIAPNATVVGDVELAESVTVWYQAVIRGDSNTVKVGARTNIQDGTVIHVDHDAPVEIAENVTVGHQCMLHGCTIEKGALIGMGSTILNHAVIGVFHHFINQTVCFRLFSSHVIITVGIFFDHFKRLTSTFC